MRKKIVSILVLSLLFSSFAFAAKYKLTGLQVTPAQFYIMDNITSTSYSNIDIAKTVAAYEWNNSVSQISINHTTNENLSPAVEVSAVNNPYDTRFGVTYIMYAPHRHQVTINNYAIEKEADGNVNDEKKIAKFVVVHEYGHLFGLDDLKLFDTRDSVMSYYANMTSIQAPTSNDIDGVNAAYGW